MAASGLGGQHDITAVDLRQLFDQGPRGVPQPGPPHPPGQGFPEDADQDGGQHAIGALMPKVAGSVSVKLVRSKYQPSLRRAHRLQRRFRWKRTFKRALPWGFLSFSIVTSNAPAARQFWACRRRLATAAPQ
jgi:hypothetical protein